MAIEDHFPEDKAKELSPIEIRISRISPSEYRLTFVGMDAVLVCKKDSFKEPDGENIAKMMEEKDRVVYILRKRGYLLMDRTIE